MRRTRGFTLLEVLLASALLAIVLGSAFLMFSTGQGAAVRGLTSIALIDGARMLDQSLMHDLQQMIPTTGAETLHIDLSGTYLSFWVPDHAKVQPLFGSRPGHDITTDAWTIPGEEVRWHLVRGARGTFHPARNAHVFGSVCVRSWQFRASRLENDQGDESAPAAATTTRPLTPPLLAELDLPSFGSEEAGPPAVETAGTAGPADPQAGALSAMLFVHELVDPDRGTTLKRSLVFDLPAVRAQAVYGRLFPLPGRITKLPPRRALPSRVALTFEPRWETVGDDVW